MHSNVLSHYSKLQTNRDGNCQLTEDVFPNNPVSHWGQASSYAC